ncbi:ABC-type polysaccharide/polyol phosphate export permease [Yoonia maricola]|uniref:ABC-type polysaccharide/polyol phosphate export permease n=2 Tax=Yoonia maricola TaxID=420999 RepID=A0A2M8W4G0_9RHOB|nr:ABC-type polysaccharide/polyol phosphate export permease [Yoonia maricola]
MLEVTYHTIVRSARSGHRNAVIALVLNMVQGLTMIVAFLLFYQVLGLRSSPIRGDMLLYIMTGIFVYLTHIKSVSAVMGAAGPTSAMMLHRPMNTIIAIVAAAVSTFYQQFITMVIILTLYHILFTPITIHDPITALGFLILAWFSGCAVGMIFLALKPWFPRFTGIAKAIYIRVNMIASGKLFVVNTLPATMIAMFDWNPLFHIIDQMRGAVFLHYNPQFTNVEYPIYLSLVFIMIGLMGEFFARQHVSLSWFAGR